MVHSNVKGRLRQDPGPQDSSSRQASSAPGAAVPAADLQVSLWGLSSESGSCFIHCNALFPFSDPKWPQFKSLTQLWAQGGVGEWSSLPECAQRPQRRPPCPTPTSTGVLLSLMCYSSCSTSAVRETALRHMTKWRHCHLQLSSHPACEMELQLPLRRLSFHTLPCAWGSYPR